MEPTTNNAPEIRPEDLIPEGVIRARAAFLRDFPKLFADKKTRGKYVCYHNDELVLVNKDYRAIEREAGARNIPLNESLIVDVTEGSEAMEREFAEEDKLQQQCHAS